MGKQNRFIARVGLLLLTAAVLAGAGRFTTPGAWAQRPASAPVPPPPKSINELKHGAALSWLHAQGDHLVDSEGRQVTLRGFVVPPRNPDGSALYLTDADYGRMRRLGADFQVVCVGATSLGLYPGVKPESNLFGRLESLVAGARKAGMYTVVRVTASDLPDEAVGAFWPALWQNQGGTRDVLVNSWRRIWAMFKDESAVLGYDLIDAPTPGRMNLSEADFVQRFLLPFYVGGIDVLRQQDPAHVVLVQPPVRSKYLDSAPWSWAVGRPNVVLSPYFHPNLPDYLKKTDLQATGYDTLMRRLVQESRQFQMPLVLAGYGMPYPPERDADKEYSKVFGTLEAFATNQLDSNDIGAARPWFSDDRSYTVIGGKRVSWSVFSGGLAKSVARERPAILDVFARPHPRRLSGTQPYYGWDVQNKRFVIRYVAKAGTTEIFVPRSRHFKEGFGVGIGTGLVMVFDPSQPRGLRALDPQRAAEVAPYEWHEEEHTLKIRETAPGTRVSVGVFPPPKPQD